MFGNDHWFKLAVPVTGNMDLDSAIVVQNYRLFTMPVAAVAGMITSIVVLFVAEMFIISALRMRP